MLAELGVDGRDPRPLRAPRSSSARPTRRSRARCRRRSTPGLQPILCVGETEAERDAGETEAVLRRQLEADLAEVDDERLAERRDRLRADLGDRHRPHRDARAGAGGDRLHPRRWSRPRDAGAAEAVRILYGGSVKPGQRRRAARRAPTSTAAWSAAPASTPATSCAICGGAAVTVPTGRAELPVPSLALVDPRRLGAGAAGPGQRGQPGRDAGLRRALGALPAHDAVGQRARRRPARRPDGQLRGRPPQPRRRRGRQAGPGADRRRDRRRQLLREPGPARRLRGGARAARAGACT